MKKFLVLALLTTAIASATTNKNANAWSGYVVTGATFTSVVATWEQPYVTCPVANARVSFWVGFDGLTTGTVEQDGTIATCSSMSAPAKYRAWWEMVTKSGKHGAQPFAISAGDIIVASVRYVGGTYQLALQDLTSGQSFSTAKTCTPACAHSSADWIVERPGSGKFPLANYTSMMFTGAMAGTTAGPGTIESNPNVTGNNVRVMMVNHKTGNTLSVPGDLVPGTTGTVFRVTWKAAQ